MNNDRFDRLPEKRILSVFFTAGFPRLSDTITILSALEASGVNMVEIGFPFSDPVADGPTIQDSNDRAIRSGMNLTRLFEQLSTLRNKITVPVLLMGYLNPTLQYGFERFVQDASRVGVDALIIPDLPFIEYKRTYASVYKANEVLPVFLVTSRTPPERILEFDQEEPAFIYVVSSEATTGGSAKITKEREDFFRRLSVMKLRSKLIVGFGVTDRDSFEVVTRYTHGAIVGSAFLRAIGEAKIGEEHNESSGIDLEMRVKEFVFQFR